MFEDFRCNISTANTLLNASYYYYTNPGSTKLRTLSYSIPNELQPDIALIDPGTYFGWADPPTPTPVVNISVKLFEGAKDNQSSTECTEANLDAQVIVGLAHPLGVTEYLTGGSPPFKENLDHPTEKKNYNEPWVPYYRSLVSTSVRDIPQVLSHSYGELEDSVPKRYATFTCNLIGIMGLRGITIIQASGDSGVGAGCLATDFKTTQFDAIFPATCPWLTSVGGTAGVSPKRAWNASSGGFSNYFPRAAYQIDTIAAYINTTVAPDAYDYYGQYTNWGGRGFPDVTAHSVDPTFEVVYVGEQAASCGTSASAPVWAAIVGLLNDARLAAGKPVLGWLNPLVYRYGPEVLTDITEGHSVGCDGVHPGSGVAEPEGAAIMAGARWNATAGWDTTTGFGAPDFVKLKDLILTL
ncbi:tripeptidyl peptidase a protein [Apiospora aurea]|uniref:Tripeptidyl peptidase a protein n=1 Tax=Apiospora aurea TaxID=335848 RepID=A0ABR1Q0N8_9PEZI